MATLQLSSVTKNFGALEVIHGIDLDVDEGEFIVFVGPSGCGKSTLLRMIAGLETVSGGTISIGGDVVNEVAPSERGIAMVFQSYALYPHMNVQDNMSFGMRLAKESPETINRKIEGAGKSLQLMDYLERLPKALSGGQRQRVAIGRAICRDPKVFLFDEPLSNLDASLRVATRIEIANLHASLPGTTMVYVTHDQVEAMTLADRIVVLSDGQIEQTGTPTELYDRPDNLFVARFIGSPAMNILNAELSNDGTGIKVAIKGCDPLDLDIGLPGGTGPMLGYLGIRPEHMRVTEPGEGHIHGEVSVIERLGEVSLIYIDHPASDGKIVAKLPGHTPLQRGDNVALTFDSSAAHVFSDAGRAMR